MNSDIEAGEADQTAGGGAAAAVDSPRQTTPLETRGEDDLSRDDAPQMAIARSLWSRPIRSAVVVILVVAAVAYTLWGTILARNVTFNQSQAIDPGASNGIRRFSRETIMDVWRTLWDKAPDFGSIDLTRVILLVSTVGFFAAFALVISLIFVPSRREWTASLGDGQESDTIAGD